jgi:hypothetical protein
MDKLIVDDRGTISQKVPYCIIYVLHVGSKWERGTRSQLMWKSLTLTSTLSKNGKISVKILLITGSKDDNSLCHYEDLDFFLRAHVCVCEFSQDEGSFVQKPCSCHVATSLVIRTYVPR